MEPEQCRAQTQRAAPTHPRRAPSSCGSDPRSANAAPTPDTHAPVWPPPEPLHLLGSRAQPGKISRCGSTRTATRAAAPPNRARPLPHASLFPGGRRHERPGAGRARGPAGTAPPPLTSDSAQEQEAPQKRHGGGRAVRGVCRGRGCGRRCGSPGASRAPDWLPAAAPLHLRATPPSLRR